MRLDFVEWGSFLITRGIVRLSKRTLPLRVLVSWLVYSPTLCYLCVNILNDKLMTGDDLGVALRLKET